MATTQYAITRAMTQALIPEDVTSDILQGAVRNSAFMSKARRLPNMTQTQQRQPILASLPVAYWLDATDTDQKDTTTQEWGNVYLNASEMAAIVPIPEAVLDDTNYDIWGEVKPRIIEALGLLIDKAAFFGTNKPAVQPSAIITAANAAGNYVSLADFNDSVDAIGGEGGLMSKVEAEGYDCNGFAGSITMKAKLRGLRDANGGLIYQPSVTAGTPSSLYGQGVEYVVNGSWNAVTALLIGGDWSKAVYAIRQDVTYKVLDQAVIQNADATIAFNLAQQDMVALRVVMRLGWQFPNPINALQPVEASRYPFAYMTA